MTVGRSSKGTVWNIQILRFVAATMVLISHLFHEISQRSTIARGFHPLEPVWWAGGVDIFFVISGFIMYYISADRFGMPGAAWRFIERRLVRLVPPYWFFTALALAAMLVVPGQMARHGFDVAQVLGSFTFIPAAGPDGKPFPILILGWTLNFEMLFYAVFAGALMVGGWRGPASIAAGLLVIAGATLLQPLPLPLGFWCNGIVIEFLFGIGLSMLHRRRVRIGAPLGALLVVLGVAALVAVKSASWAGVAFNWRFLWAGVPSLLICAGVVLVPEGERPGALRRLFVYLGDTSFSLYLSHPFVLSVVAVLAAKMGVTGGWTYFALAFVACIAGAAVFFSLIEKPTYSWLTRTIDARRATLRARPA